MKEIRTVIIGFGGMGKNMQKLLQRDRRRG